jgi:hypothetical protein
MRLAGHHPAWALGFEDETWWSRVAHPHLPAWAPTPQPLRLVTQTLAKTDPDPKALACYGLLLRWLSATGVPQEAVWLRFVEGRPVSAITTAFLALPQAYRPWQKGVAPDLGQRLLAPESGGTHLDPRAQPPGEAGEGRSAYRGLPVADQKPVAEPSGTTLGPWQAWRGRGRWHPTRVGVGRPDLRLFSVCS